MFSFCHGLFDSYSAMISLICWLVKESTHLLLKAFIGWWLKITRTCTCRRCHLLRNWFDYACSTVWPSAFFDLGTFIVNGAGTYICIYNWWNCCKRTPELYIQTYAWSYRPVGLLYQWLWNTSVCILLFVFIIIYICHSRAGLQAAIPDFT